MTARGARAVWVGAVWGGMAIILAVFGGAVSDARADPSALVVGVAGTTVPPVKLYDELDEQSAVRLKPGSKLIVLHYRACKQVTVTAGVLNIANDGYSIDGARSAEEERVTCPREQKLISEENFIANSTFYREQRAASTLTATRVFHPVSLPIRMNAVLVGAKAAQVRAMQVLLDDDVVTDLAVEGRKVTSPDAALSLRAGMGYVLRVTFAGTAAPVDYAFLAINPGSSDAALTVIRVD